MAWLTDGGKEQSWGELCNPRKSTHVSGQNVSQLKKYLPSFAYERFADVNAGGKDNVANVPDIIHGDNEGATFRCGHGFLPNDIKGRR